MPIRMKNQPPKRTTVTHRRTVAEFVYNGLIKCCGTCRHLFQDAMSNRQRCNKLDCEITDPELSAVCKHHSIHVRPERSIKKVPPPRMDKKLLERLEVKVREAEKYTEETGEMIPWAATVKRIIETHG